MLSVIGLSCFSGEGVKQTSKLWAFAVNEPLDLSPSEHKTPPTDSTVARFSDRSALAKILAAVKPFVIFYRHVAQT